MYALTPAIGHAWTRLFDWVSRTSGVPLEVIDHAFPAPLSALWERADLGCAFMCGFPYTRSGPRLTPVAAPVPRPARFGARPSYVTDLVVRADSPFRTLEDTFGRRLGYTVEDSHSGYNALRHHLLPFHAARGAPLYARTVGPLHTPRRVLDALLSGEIDVGPLDGYALDLLARHEPALARAVRVVETTAAAPIPLLVASAGCPGEVVARLRAALLAFGADAEAAPLAEALCLLGFAPVRPQDYEAIAALDRDALDAGYDRPG